MKKIGFLSPALILFFYACTPVQYSTWKSPQPQPAVVVENNNEVTDQTFYDNLAPDGRWISDPELGYVWSPNVGADFRPYYTNGHWTYTNYGWTWVSDYNWGWATFHYGRWKFDNTYGWVWAPGHEWAPAWVQWRKTPEAYGWAPLEPGISIEVGFSSGYHIPDNHWCFVPQQHFADRDFHRYVPPVQQNNVYINKSTIINNNITINNVHNTTINNTTINNDNRKYIGGPQITEVRNVTHQNIQVYNIQNNNKPGATIENNNSVNIYRPVVRENNGNQNNRPAPSHVVNQPQGQPVNQTRLNEQNNQYQQAASQTQQAPQKRWNTNNLPAQTTNPPTTPQKQEDKPVLNPAENKNRAPGDATPYSPTNNNTPRQNNWNNQPKNEQPIPNTQPQTPRPNNNGAPQNPNPYFQQRQPNANATNQNQQNTTPQNYNNRYQPTNRTPQNQPQQNQNPQNRTPQNQQNPARTFTPNPNSGTNPAQNKPTIPHRQPATKPVDPPKSSTQPVAPPKENKPAQQQ